MKAIVVLFPGSFISEEHERTAMSSIVNTIDKAVPCSIERVEAYILDETSVLNALVGPMLKEKAKEESLIDKRLSNYCQTVCSLCNPIDYAPQHYKEAFIRNFINSEELRKDKEVITFLINNKKPTKAIAEILAKYNLSELPSYLRQLNFLINIL